MPHNKHTSKILQFCKKINTKKYISRTSPPYSAADCPNKKLKGNDGKYYISLPTYNTGIYRWYLYSKELIGNFNKKMDENRYTNKIKRTLTKKNKIVKNKTLKNNK